MEHSQVCFHHFHHFVVENLECVLWFLGKAAAHQTFLGRKGPWYSVDGRALSQLSFLLWVFSPLLQAPGQQVQGAGTQQAAFLSHVEQG